MEQEFWQSRWRENKTTFHENRPNGLLQQHFHRLGLHAGDTVFVPLCGKAVDLDWLGGHGLNVVGIEFNADAVKTVFARQHLTSEIRGVGSLTSYHAETLRIFVGDFFDLTRDVLGSVDAVYDRAALVAMPTSMREKYAAHLADVTGNARQLLITYDYDQSQTDGPPFSVPRAEVERVYDGRYGCEPLSSRAIAGPLAQRCSGHENAQLLTPR